MMTLRLERVRTMLLVHVLLSVAVLSTATASAPTAVPPSAPLSEALHRIFEQEGAASMLAAYQNRDAAELSGLIESDQDTRQLAIRLAERGHPDAAAALLRLNLEAHPNSLAARKRLAELLHGQQQIDAAIEQYQIVLQQVPEDKDARYALYHLSGRWPGPFPFMVVIHVLGGVLAILAGWIAMLVRKGSRWHSRAGKVFVGAMTAMALSASARAMLKLPEEQMNFWMGAVTLYLVLSSWHAIRQRPGKLSAAILFGFALFAGILVLGLVDVTRRGGFYAAPALMFGTMMLFAAIADVRLARIGHLSASARLTRHWWRMGAAMFIAVASFFLGQSQVFPREIQQSGVLAVPVLLVLLVLGYWAFRSRSARFQHSSTSIFWSA